ncbi:MAG: anti-phage deoxyguanosine triphosphatase [Paracoccus sp. (in: a-proteobacteria)]|uniref:anti-phage deoxyguanosine triphosphatase n=1 Tax=Paracoccus sp. TaxID=267 RepID=UPI0039E40E93
MVWDQRREGGAPRQAEARDPGEIDYARVIHSASFRRLQGKTQILNLGDGDFYRTRLTHSLEVSQIAGGLVAQLARNFPDHPARAHLPGRSRIQAIACAHDLGHPPFGHGGEVALNYCMRDAGGFEGNGQTLRLLARIEAFSRTAGADLTRRSLLGVLKYPVGYARAANPALKPCLHGDLSVLRTIDLESAAPPKCYLESEAEVVDWILAPLSASDRDGFAALAERPRGHAKSLHKSLDCSIMDLADDIAYGVHDLEDAFALGLVGANAFRAAVTPEDCASLTGCDHNALAQGLAGSEHARKRVIGDLVHHLIAGVGLVAVQGFHDPLLAWRAAIPPGPQRLLAALKSFVMGQVIRSPSVQQLEFKGQAMVVQVFQALQSDPQRLLPRPWLARLERDGMRAICDHVASLTDAGLLKSYERLFAPRMGSVFDRL